MFVACLVLIFKPFEFGPFKGGVDVILLKLDRVNAISLYHLCLEDSHHKHQLLELPVFLGRHVDFLLNT